MDRRVSGAARKDDDEGRVGAQVRRRRRRRTPRAVPLAGETP
jgi:hypothetical protein